MSEYNVCGVSVDCCSLTPHVHCCDDVEAKDLEPSVDRYYASNSTLFFPLAVRWLGMRIHKGSEEAESSMSKYNMSCHTRRVMLRGASEGIMM